MALLVAKYPSAYKIYCMSDGTLQKTHSDNCIYYSLVPDCLRPKCLFILHIRQIITNDQAEMIQYNQILNATLGNYYKIEFLIAPPFQNDDYSI